jgi:hypothetical protein
MVCSAVSSATTSGLESMAAWKAGLIEPLGFGPCHLGFVVCNICCGQSHASSMMGSACEAKRHAHGAHQHNINDSPWRTRRSCAKMPPPGFIIQSPRGQHMAELYFCGRLRLPTLLRLVCAVASYIMEIPCMVWCLLKYCEVSRMVQAVPLRCGSSSKVRVTGRP